MKTFILFSFLVICQFNLIGQTNSLNHQKGSNYLVAAVAFIGSGVLFHDANKIFADNRYENAKADAFSKFEKSTRSIAATTKFEKSMEDAALKHKKDINTGIYVRGAMALTGVILCVFSIDAYNQDGSVKLKSNGTTSLNAFTSENGIGLCLKF